MSYGQWTPEQLKAALKRAVAPYSLVKPFDRLRNEYIARARRTRALRTTLLYARLEPWGA